MRLARHTGTPVVLSFNEDEEPVVLMGLDSYESLMGVEEEGLETTQDRMSFEIPVERRTVEEIDLEEAGDIEGMEVDLPVLESISEVDVETGESPAASAPQKPQEFAPKGEERFYLEPID